MILSWGLDGCWYNDDVLDGHKYGLGDIVQLMSP